MAQRKSLYSVHPSVFMIQSWIATLQEKTGHTLEEWLRLINQKGPATQAARLAWLKSTYQLGTNKAGWLAGCSLGKGLDDGDPESYLQAAQNYVEEMFAGKKAGLRPIYEALLHFGLNIARDVKACPCRTLVPFYRNHVFAQIKPSTLRRIDIGFALRDTRTCGRLIDTGGFAKKDRITHRIPIASVLEIDDEVKRWFRIAYDMDA